MTTNKQLRELAEKATPGPWGWDGPVWGYDAENEAPWLIQEQGSGVVITGELQCSETNAKYIAAVSPEVITALLDENEALQAECEELRKDAERYQSLLEAVLCEIPHREGSRGNAPGHGHSVLGVWDEDNGALAGKECAWCKVWNEAVSAMQEENK